MTAHPATSSESPALPAFVVTYLTAHANPASPADVNGILASPGLHLSGQAHQALEQGSLSAPMSADPTSHAGPLDTTANGDAMPLAGFHFPDVTIHALDPANGVTEKVEGRDEAPEGMQFYGIQFHPDSSSIRLDAQGTDPGINSQLWLMDVQGHVFGQFGLPGSGGKLSLMIQSRDPSTPEGSELVVGISGTTALAPNGSAASSDASGSTFSMWVSRNDASPATSGGIVSTPQQTTSLSNLSKEESSSETETAAAGLGDDSVGPLPMRSVGPSAGVLADGLPIPPVDRDESAVVDLSLIDMAAEDGADFAASLKHGRTPANGLIELRTAGGFPLLGTALAAPESVYGSLTERPDRTTTVSVRKPEPTPGQGPTPLKSSGAAIRPGAIALGFSLAGGLAYTLLLPDLERRLEPEKPKPPPLKK